MSSILTADVLMTIFDLLDFRALRECSHVSPSWRALARHHPAFWKTLSISDKSLTRGAARIFLDRLHARCGDDAVVSLTMRCTNSQCSLMMELVLPAIKMHIHRCEEIALVVSAASSASVWPLFAIAAPRLKNLQLIVRRATGDIAPLPQSMFHAHEYRTLQRVIFFDVPLPQGLHPILHTMESMKITYARRRSQMRDALRWLPNTRALDIALGPPATEWEYLSLSRILLDDYPHLNAVQRLDVYDPDLLLLPRSEDIPVLTIQMLLPRSVDIYRLLPMDSPLCMCLRTEIRRDVPASTGLSSGVITISTPSRDVVRHIYGMSPLYMKTRDVLQAVVQPDRLMMLVIELSAGFAQLCHAEQRFPRLETLCIIITLLPTDIIRWTSGTIACPRLRTFVLQRNRLVDHVIVSRDAVDQFIAEALLLEEDACLDVVLKGVWMTGSRERGGYVASITHRNSTGQEELEKEDRAARQATNMLSSSSTLPWMGWMDVSSN